MTTKGFNFSELEASAMEQLRAGKSLLGSDGALTPLIKHFTEAALRAELDAHLANEQSDTNRKNGKATKKMRSGYGTFELDTPRDRASSFEPQLVKKRQTLLTKELEDKVISLFGLGSSYSGIRSHIEEIYGIDISETTVSAVTDKLLPEIDAWRTRSLNSVYPIVWMDAMFFKIREEGHVKSKPLYSLMGLNQRGPKEVLGVYVQAVNIDSAEHQLDILEEKWGKKYPHVIRAWRNNWEHLSGYFLFSEPIRKVIYTTNIIEGYHRQIRKVTKSKEAFSSEKGLLKLVYLVTQRIEKKRSVAVVHWNLALAQLDIHFPGRLELNI